MELANILVEYSNQINMNILDISAVFNPDEDPRCRESETLVLLRRVRDLVKHLINLPYVRCYLPSEAHLMHGGPDTAAYPLPVHRCQAPMLLLPHHRHRHCNCMCCTALQYVKQAKRHPELERTRLQAALVELELWDREGCIFSHVTRMHKGVYWLPRQCSDEAGICFPLLVSCLRMLRSKQSRLLYFALHDISR